MAPQLFLHCKQAPRRPGCPAAPPQVCKTGSLAPALRFGVVACSLDRARARAIHAHLSLPHNTLVGQATRAPSTAAPTRALLLGRYNPNNADGEEYGGFMVEQFRSVAALMGLEFELVNHPFSSMGWYAPLDTTPLSCNGGKDRLRVLDRHYAVDMHRWQHKFTKSRNMPRHFF